MKKKILLIAAVFFVLSGVLLTAVQSGILLPGFRAVQMEAAEKDLQRCLRALDRELEHLDTLCWDWASWDDTYAFMDTRSEAYVRSNLVVSTFTDNRIQLIQMVTPTGEVFWRESRDREGTPMKLPAFPDDRYPASSPILQALDPASEDGSRSVTGFRWTGAGPILVAARPVLTSMNQGPPRGVLIMGRLLDAELLAELGRRVLVDCDVLALTGASGSVPRGSIRRTLGRKDGTALHEAEDGRLFADAIVNDLAGEPAMGVRARMQPEFDRIGRKTLHFSGAAMVVCGIAVTVLLLAALQRIFLRPLTELTRHAREVRSTGDMGRRLRMDRRDEIGELAAAWDRLLQQAAENEATIREANRRLQQDVAERLRTEERVRHREHYYRTLMENMQNDVLVVDEDHCITDGNRSTFETLGAERRSVVGGSADALWSRLDPTVSSSDIRALLAGVFRTANPAFCRFEGDVGGRGHRILDIRMSPIRSGERVSHVIVSLGDVTRQVQLDRQLHQLQKIEALGTMAAGISHEFNNILMSILLNLESVLRRTGDAYDEESLRIAYDAALRAKNLVRQMRIFSRQRKDPPQPIEAAPLVKESLKMIRSSLPDSVRLRTDLQAEGEKLWIAPDQIQQILVNLCLNASHAMREKGGEIFVRTTRRRLPDEGAPNDPDLAPGDYLVLSVEDTGEGMDSRTVSRIFDPFFTMKHTGEGTGLGLSVVHGIVRENRGGITVDSEPGKGTKLTVFLPLGDGTQAPAAEAGFEKPDPTEAPGPLRLLLVDDEETIVASLSRVLENFGHTVDGVSDGKTALQRFRQDPSAYDAVISDISMPGLSGIDLAEAILSLRPETPVILCTGFQDEPDPEKLRRTGVRTVLKKPLNIGEIHVVLLEQVEQKP